MNATARNQIMLGPAFGTLVKNRAAGKEEP